MSSGVVLWCRDVLRFVGDARRCDVWLSDVSDIFVLRCVHVRFNTWLGTMNAAIAAYSEYLNHTLHLNVKKEELGPSWPTSDREKLELCTGLASAVVTDRSS